ncbi:hypothetical protein Msil_2302 [Methylocella silvestris BL2]|uniref:Uncharacterized protein n=1 Tax=Methylocella silvestris (strain DSM 15510 / CIP 108128 / LMG 27833 / NCIMB 13906 / BL2) TaxID=395965 RepID=B8EIB4_METSB|nr:hypothetical protein [Methylocella silvestris]ACK51233.1 hypothetical protein Msil_2302 [Methylocella silvestris BL2]
MSFDQIAIAMSRALPQQGAEGNSLAQIVRLGAIVIIAALSIATAAALRETPSDAPQLSLAALPASAR